MITLGGVQMNCAVLKDGRRVISERSFSTALGHERRPEEYEKRKQALAAGEAALPVFVTPNVVPFLPPGVAEKLAKPIRYQVTEGFGIPAYGVEATLIADICEAFIAAREAGALSPEEQPKAVAALTLIRALARVAIVALIDEATGYQVIRARDELQRLLEKYVSEEFREWSRAFPDEFYIELFRLRNLTTDDVRHRPSYFGHLTNDIVYDRIIPGMLPRLKEVNPTNEKGRRARKHHMHITSSEGEKHLRSHVAGVVMLMKSHTNYNEFKRALDRAAPKQRGIEASAGGAEPSDDE
jgi:hypothetical protein